MTEIHVVIVWANARYKEQEILKDLETTFVVKRKYYITWSKHKVYENMSRFYAIKSRYAKDKLRHCGSGEFLVIIVEDLQPIYEMRRTSSGMSRVNKRLFDKKMLYRSWTNEGHRVHTSNDVTEAEHNIALLFGKTYDEFYKSLSQDSETITVNRDLVGSEGWEDFETLFTVLNSTLTYVVLRNFEGYFESITTKEHLDIDFLVRDYTEAKLILNGREKYPNTSRVVNEVKVAGINVDFDLRSISDGYMPEKWSRVILEKRIKTGGYFRPDSQNYFYSLIYHVCVHKEFIAKDYIVRLERMKLEHNVLPLFTDSNAFKILDSFMKDEGLIYSEPKDLSVFYNWKNLKLSISLRRKVILIYRELRRIVKIILCKS